MNSSESMKAALIAALILFIAPAGAKAEAPPATAQSAPAERKTDELQIPSFTYPPSALVSDELRQAYAKALAAPGNGTITIPDNPRVVAIMRSVVNTMFEKSLPWVRERYPVETTSETIAGVEVIRVRPQGGITKNNRKRVLINVHGGSFMVGWPSVALLDAIPVASLSGIEVITINYRLYPEAVHPAGLEDLTAVYRELLKSHKAANIGIFGGSAGGVITLQSVPWLKRHGLPRPGAIAPLSAAFRTAIGDSAIWNFSGGFSLPGTRLVEIGGYLGNHDRKDWIPGVTPDDLASYPPTLWLAGTRAPELSGVATAHASMLGKGLDSQFYLIEGGWHQSYSTAPQSPESQAAMRYVAHWFDTRLGR